MHSRRDHRVRWLLAGGALALGLGVAALLGARALPESRPAARLLEAYGQLPLTFEPNHGQTDSQVMFLARSQGATLFLTHTEAVLTLGPRAGAAPGREPARPTVVRLRLVGAHPAPEVVGQDPLPGQSHYFRGSDPKQWRTHIPHYARVKYAAVYPGVDLVFYGSPRALEYDFVLAPGADPGAIALSFAGVDRLALEPQGDLLLHTAGGVIRQRKPTIYQEVDGVRQAITGGYVLKDNQQVGFHVAAYDASRPLVIDPVLSYSTYLGGTDSDTGFDIAVDSAGNAYVTGQSNTGNDAFVTKLNPTGSAVVYSTVLGGSDPEAGFGIAVDSAGNAYVTGSTSSTDFPTTSGAFDQTANGGDDAFVTKLNPAGSALVYSTYLGGSGQEEGRRIAVDSAGNAYVTGFTASTNFPTANPIQAALGGVGANDVFVTKLNPAGSALVYSTYLGGSGGDQSDGIAVDGAGNAYVTGETASADFPTASPVQAALSGGGNDAFVTKLNPAGSALVYSTYLGGSGLDSGFGIAVDGAGNAYVTGRTASADFPTASPVQATLGSGGSFDAFVTKLNPAGSALVYSTYLGGSGSDEGLTIAVDSAGNAYVTGPTGSANFPTANPVQAALGGGGNDAFVTKLNPAGSALVYSTYLGGSGPDSGISIAVDGAGSAYVTGETASTNFPTTAGAFDQTSNGGGDTFVAKLSELATEKGKSGDECFIATAAFGSPLAAEVQTLRTFRDRYLLPHGPGQFLAAAYARVSPPLAARIREQEALRAATRLALRPILWWAHLALVFPVLALALGGATLMAGPLLLIHLRRARRTRARGRNP